MKGGAKTIVEGHRHAGVFIARGKEDALVSKNMVPGTGSDLRVDSGVSQILIMSYSALRQPVLLAFSSGTTETQQGHKHLKIFVF